MRVETEQGFIELRKPNVLEGLEFFGKMGLNSENIKDADHLMQNDLYYTAQSIKNMKPFIKEMSIKIGKKKITDYEDAITHMECMGLLTMAGAELMGCMRLDEKKRD